MTTHTKPSTQLFAGFLAAALGVGMIASMPAQAGDWGFSIHVPGHYRWHHRPYRIYHRDYAVGGGYYPVYNPVVERDVYRDGHYHRDGTHHSEQTVEDRHDSYYSPGRNEAITRPRTTVEEYRGPGYGGERERTSWIGADGRPHSTTIDRVTTQDPWGNSHTDTQVTLKKRGEIRETPKESSVKAPVEGKKPKKMSKNHPNAPSR